MQKVILKNRYQIKIHGSFKRAFLYFLLPGLMMFTSCSTLRYSALDNNQVELNKDNLELLNGCYKRFPDDTCNGDARDMQRLMALKLLDQDRKNEYVKFGVVDETHLKYEYFDEGGLVYSKVIKGELKNGEFECNRRTRVWAIIVATVYIDSKVRIGVLKNRNLIIDAKCTDYGLCFFLFPAFPTSDKKYDQVFERIESCQSPPAVSDKIATN